MEINTYLHNAAGQRVFKSEPQVAQTSPSEEQLGTDFITWLKKELRLIAQGNLAAMGPLSGDCNLGTEHADKIWKSKPLELTSECISRGGFRSNPPLVLAAQAAQLARTASLRAP